MDGRSDDDRDHFEREGIDGLPDIVYVPDLARLLQISEKALRQRAARGQVPRPFRLGRALAWTRDSVVAWLRDCGRSARLADMKINLRPYLPDTTRWQVDIRLFHPCEAEQTIRRRIVAPAGLSQAQARTWGERQIPTILRELMGEATPAVARSAPAKGAKAAPVEPEVKRPRRGRPPRDAQREPKPKPAVTLAEFANERFFPEHVALQKRSTQDTYDSHYRLHILPRLGALPLAVIDEDRLSAFRADLRRKLGPSTVNLVLSLVAKTLRFARKVKVLAQVPEIEKLPVPRTTPKQVFSTEEIDKLLTTAASIDTTREVICLLALDAGLRVSELCALEWDDVDLKGGVLTIQHNVYCGRKQTPKGTIGRVVMTAALRDALARHRERALPGPTVLCRRDSDVWRPFARSAIANLLRRLQQKAGVRTSGPHLLRHTSLTRLADLGASVYVIQAVARHSDLKTTQAYLHTQQATRTLEAAWLLDKAAARGKNQANRANSDES